MYAFCLPACLHACTLHPLHPLRTVLRWSAAGGDELIFSRNGSTLCHLLHRFACQVHRCKGVYFSAGLIRAEPHKSWRGKSEGVGWGAGGWGGCDKRQGSHNAWVVCIPSVHACRLVGRKIACATATRPDKAVAETRLAESRLKESLSGRASASFLSCSRRVAPHIIILTASLYSIALHLLSNRQQQRGTFAVHCSRSL